MAINVRIPPSFGSHLAKDVSNPPGRVTDVFHQLFACSGIKAPVELCNHMVIDLLLSDVAQRLNDQTADSSGSGHVAGRSPLQNDLSFAYRHGTGTTIREIDNLHGYLGRQPEQIGGICA